MLFSTVRLFCSYLVPVFYCFFRYYRYKIVICDDLYIKKAYAVLKFSYVQLTN